MSRAQSEVLGQIMSAKQFPRDEAQAGSKILARCARARFADEALYAFPRGGKTISGPSVNLARSMAQAWGNIVHRIQIVRRTEEETHIAGQACDLESNTWVSSEAVFKNQIYRKNKGWIEPDERDYRELVNKHGAICVRNAILQLIPKDIVDEAVDECHKTNRLAVSGEIEQDKAATIRSLLKAFNGFGILREDLERNIDTTLERATADDIAGLRDIFRSMSDGNTKPDDHFEKAPSASERLDNAAPKDGDQPGDEA